MDELQALMGDSYKEGLTVEDITNFMKGKKFADLSQGGYVDVNKYNNEIANLNKTITDKDNTIKAKDNELKSNKMAHCNYEHMLYAIAGMAHQLTKRNMPAGKRYSHVLRLYSLIEKFLGFYPSTTLLQLMPSDYQEALHAKRDTMQSHDAYYNDGCENIAALLDKKRDAFI